ncbi:SMC family protein [Blastopirellula retiformator]|uniref:Chromosome partition protein Smc n=1 Tax=Blastopirellula retiformator TaxID=2527970 RepID=A0A5C5V4C5_9BACT|nr:hypothetical protein [Blastopirellula retiformator]TWT33408.1 Chromosome partition protein Smc [Blastopirellula retiformator]
MSKMLDALKRLQEQGAAPASTPTINNTVGQVDAVREVAAAVDQAVAETEQRLRDEYQRQIDERDQQLAEQRKRLEAELGAEKTRLQEQLAQLESQLASHQDDATAHEELQTELQAELERHQAESVQRRQEDEARFRKKQQALEAKLQEFDLARQQLTIDATRLSEQLSAKEAELQEVQQAIQAAPTVDEQTLRASLSDELSKQAEEFARKEAELNEALAEARQTVETQQQDLTEARRSLESHENDLAEVVRLRAAEKAQLEQARRAADAKAEAAEVAAASARAAAAQASASPANAAEIARPAEPSEEPHSEATPPPVRDAKIPMLLRPSFTSAVPRPHLCSYEEQTKADLQDARISERYERLAQPTSKPTSTLFLSADGGDDAHQAGFHTALAVASKNRRVLVIDGDVHGKQLSHRLGLRDSLGFYEVIRRETKLSERVVGLQCGEIDFLPAGRSLYTVSRSDLESAQAVWQEFSEIWPLVILVGEHPGAVSTELYAVLCQSIYLTACLGRATKDDVKAASKRIASIGGRIEAAVAMNAKLK